MRFLDSAKAVLALVGPTAVGKTELSLQIAEQLNGEIISADSRCFYRGMDIGTAKPSLEERARIPHHLVDILNPDEAYSLAEFQLAASEAIETIHMRHKLPILVGGTGQYVWSMVEGWKIPPQEPDLHLRRALEHWADTIGPAELYQRLKYLDPEAATHIEPNNVRRTVRGLEVIFRTGKRFSAQKQKELSPYDWLIIGVARPRTEVFQRIDQRVDAMISAGLENEVRGLLSQGYSPELPALSAIGYREMVSVVQGLLTTGEAATRIKSLTHQFVRRQTNWFKADDPRIHWVEAGSTQAEDVLSYIRSAQGL